MHTLLKTIPREVTLGGYKWKIIFEDKPHIKGEDVWGWTDFGQRYIGLYSGMTDPALILEVILHEISHVIWNFFSLNQHKEPTEEVYALASGIGWSCFYRENPEFLTWMKKGLR